MNNIGIRLIDLFFSMKWLWFVAIILLYKLISKYINSKNENNALDVIKLDRTTEYSEEKIVAHLDYIINEALDQYSIFRLQPKGIYYINSKMETELIEYLTDKIPGRISALLMQQLRLVYNEDYVAEFIGSRIYISVLNYVLEYNINNNPDQNAKKATDAIIKK